MKTLFKLLLVLLITAQLANAQKSSTIEMDEIHTIYDESFITDRNTTFVLNLSNSAAQIRKSKDNKLHIKYTMEFKNYRKKVVASRLKNAVATGKKKIIRLRLVQSQKYSSFYRQYRIEEFLTGRLGKNIDSTKTEKQIIRKSLDSIFEQIKFFERNRYTKLTGTYKSRPGVKKWKKSDKLQITRMVIYVPENVHFRATLDNANLVFYDNISNQLTFNSRNSRLKFKTLGNKLNVLDIDKGYFLSNEVKGGRYNFANTKEVVIGKISESILNSEFTKVELGEIGKNNTISDFSSRYFIHNYNSDFGLFNLKTDYTELNIFLPFSQDYYVETFGNQTIHYKDGLTTKFSISTKNEPSKMMVIGKEKNTNQIKINTTHGIIRFGEQSISF